ncbi:putative cell-to-cell movement protein [Patrinia mild mottle virus]|uniref:Putative cell-to-cell movement protein n=1 Tax=Patrinia mild mottle virus TaxID=2518104 RepID=A0A411I687_9TOMB|nr:putative cell-to-cell movement protein [Patrinia mild mottle virus]QBB78571.1 putative cell-to-cell movement protein [Patrinia mild mottle virus]
MSIQTTKANNKEELLELLGAGLKEELEESGLGKIVPVHVDSKIVHTQLLPARARQSLVSRLLQKRATKFTGGLLFIPQLVVVFVPHVPDHCPGTVTLWVHDPILPNNNDVCGRVTLPLNNGQQFVLFQPHYSIPLADSVGGRPRCFSVVCEQSGTGTLNGGSAFSLFLMWEPEISHQAHNYLPQAPIQSPVKREALRNLLLTKPMLRDQSLLATTSQRFARSVAVPPTQMCIRCGATTGKDHLCPSGA